MSLENNGFARKIYEDSDADLQIEGLYAEISTALLTNVSFSYVDSEIDEKTVTQTNFPIYLGGSELVVAGKLKDESLAELQLVVYGHAREGTIELERSSDIVPFNLTSAGDFSSITEKMWAYLSIKQLIRDMDKDITDEEREAIKNKILDMSLKVSFYEKRAVDLMKERGERCRNTTNLSYQDGLLIIRNHWVDDTNVGPEVP